MFWFPGLLGESRHGGPRCLTDLPCLLGAIGGGGDGAAQGCAGAMSHPVAVWVQQRQSLLTRFRVLWLPVVRQWSDVLGAAHPGEPAERFPHL